MTNEVYTAEVTEELKNAYVSAESDEQRAEVVAQYSAELGVSDASVRGKLAHLKVYVPKAGRTKDGRKIESKAKIVQDIAHLMGENEEVVESLEKATKTALLKLRNALGYEIVV